MHAPVINHAAPTVSGVNVSAAWHQALLGRAQANELSRSRS